MLAGKVVDNHGAIIDDTGQNIVVAVAASDWPVFNPDFPLEREAMSRRFGMPFSRHVYRRVGDTGLKNGAENAPKAPDSDCDS
jgi:hypothetical protein